MARKPVPAAQSLPGETSTLGLERLIFFSDAVFAIAITLLVLEIRLPTGAGELNDAQLLQSLLGLWHRYLAYAISFLVIGSIWMAHHRKFRLIQGFDRRLLFLNLLLLMVVAFLPFPTSVISENPGRTATVFYALTVSLSGLLSLLVWLHASRPGSPLTPNLSPEQRRLETVRGIVFTVVFLLSIGIAFIDPDGAKFFWLATLPAYLFFDRR